MMSVKLYNNDNTTFGFKDTADSPMVRSSSAMEGSTNSHQILHRDSPFSDSFPPRKRSIPLGFDFDMDEVWAPLSPHLQNVHRNHLGQAESSSSASSSSSLYSGNRRSEARKAMGFDGSSRIDDLTETKSQDSEEFAVDNDEIFQKMNSMSRRLDRGESNDLNNSTATFTSGLPSARTLRGGQPPVVRGRHSSLDTRFPKTSSPFQMESGAVNTHSRNRKGSFTGQSFSKK